MEDILIIRLEIAGISPFFMVKNAARTSFYRDQLGFEVSFQGFGGDPFFGIMRCGGALIMIKDVGVVPLPNYRRGAGSSLGRLC